MSTRALGPANVTAGAVVVGGFALVVLPGYAVAILQITLVSIGVTAGVHALVANVPQSGWISPFKWLSPFSRHAHPGRVGHRSDDLDAMRGRLGARRQRIERGPPLPPGVLRQLQPLIAAGLDIDVRDRAALEAARDRLSAPTYAVLTSEPLERATYLRTVGSDAGAVAASVHRVLEEIDELTRVAREHA